MKFISHISLIFILLASLSCTKKEGHSKSETIRSAINSLILDNTNNFENLEYLVKENGQREADLKMLNALKAIVLTTSFKVLANESMESNSSDAFLSYADHLTSIAADYDWVRKEPTETIIERIQSCKLVFTESKDSLDYDFLRYNVYLLQKAFIDEASAKVGVRSFDFDIFNMYYYSDTLKNGEEFKANITIRRKNLNPDYLSITEQEIELRSESGEITNYSLENIASDSWVFRFTPNKPGLHSFKFSIILKSLLVQENTDFPFYIEKEFYVE